MDGFKQGYGVRTDISGSSHPESTLQCRGKIGNDISEHVVRYDHLKIVWLPNHEQAQRIDVEMAGLNPGVAGSGILKAALPQITGIGHHIGLIAHAHFGFSGAARMIERVPDNPVHALTRVDLHLSGDFIGSTLLENAAGVDIRAFRVLTDYREVHVLDTHSFQWAQLLVEQPDRTHIGKQIQTKTKGQEYFGRVPLIGNPRIADRSKQNGVEILAKHFERPGRQSNAFPEIFLSAPIELDELQSGAEYLIHAAQHAHGLAGDIDSDTVSGNDRDPFHRYVGLPMIQPACCTPRPGPSGATLRL